MNKKLIIILLSSLMLSSCMSMRSTTYYVTGETPNGTELQGSVQLKRELNVGETVRINGEKVKLTRVRITKIATKRPSNTFR